MTPNKLRERRLEVGISQTALARAAGLADSAVSDFENGKRLPWPKARRALAKALKVREGDLFPAESEGQGGK